MSQRMRLDSLVKGKVVSSGHRQWHMELKMAEGRSAPREYTGRILWYAPLKRWEAPTEDVAEHIERQEGNLIRSFFVPRVNHDQPTDMIRLWREAPEYRGKRNPKWVQPYGITREGLEYLHSVQRKQSPGLLDVARAMAAREAEGPPSEQQKEPEPHGPSRDERPEEPEQMAEGEAIPPGADIGEDEESAGGPTQLPVVFNKDKETLTTSLAVAKAYGKQHKHVLRDIERILEPSPNLGSAFVFRKTEYVGKDNAKRPMYEMNQNAFVALVGEFSGAKARKTRIAYIIEFERMKAALKEQAQQQASGQDMVAVFAGLSRMLAETIAGIPTAVVGAIQAGMAAHQQQPSNQQPTPRQGFPGGTESFKDFCGHHADINVQWLYRFLSEDGIHGDGMGAGRIRQDSATNRWVCTERAAHDEPRLFVDIKGAVVIAGVDKPYAHITKPHGVRWLTKQLDQLRKANASGQPSQGKFDLGKKKDGMEDV